MASEVPHQQSAWPTAQTYSVASGGLHPVQFTGPGMNVLTVEPQQATVELSVAANP